MNIKRYLTYAAMLLLTIVAAIYVPYALSETVQYSDFSGGVRNDIQPDLVALNQSPDAENVITNDSGTSIKKRGGYGLFKVLTDSMTYAVEGITSFRQQDTGNDYFIVAHGKYLSKVNQNTNIDFCTTRTTTTKCYEDFTLNDKYVYGCDGYDYNWKYDGTTFTQISSYTFTTNDDAIYISTLTSSGTTATAITSYTITNLVAGDSVLIAGVTNYTSYNGTYDVLEVLGVSSFTYTLSASTGTPAAGTTITAINSVKRYEFPKTFTHSFYQERYFVACTTSNPNTVWQSYYNQPENFTTYDATNPDLAADQYDVGAAGERIVKLVPYNGGLMVFKSRSIYKIIGDGTPMQILTITTELGCNNPNSIIEDNAILYFFGSDGYYYLYDGTSFSRISQNIKNTTKKIPQTVGKLNSIKWDTFSEFDLGTSSNTNITYDGKIIPGKILDNFNDGDFTGWQDTFRVEITTFNTNRKNNQNFLSGTGISARARKTLSGFTNMTDMLGVWTFDIHNAIPYITTTTYNIYFMCQDATSFLLPKYEAQLVKAGSSYPLHYMTMAGQSSIAADTSLYTMENFYYKIVVSSSSSGNSYFDAKLYINNNLILSSTLPRLSEDMSSFAFKLSGFSPSVGISYIYYPIKETDTCTYVSEIKDIGINSTLSTFIVSENLNNETINYYMRANASSTSITSDAWTLVNKNSQINITSAQYVQWKAEFITNDITILPELDNVELTYIEVTNNVISQGVLSNKFLDTKLYSSITNTDFLSAIYNNYSLTFDLINAGIWKNSGIYAYDFCVLSNELYYGDSRYGVILKYNENAFSDYNVVTSSSVAINSYYYTNQNYLSAPYNKKLLSMLSLGMKKQSSGSLLIDYLINGYTANTLTYPMTGTIPTIFKVSKYRDGEKGNYFQWKFYNNTVDEDFELYLFSTDYRIMPVEISK